ncbi:Prophage tail fibre N-terminal [Serratia fonticola]|uniref:prophage tail fiber N-terminal domain-containing protein n=1 Tax=Serratia fonticola TaxID=47917 RepID=UPI00217CAF2E|nr:prophage tail fiber N-terminal domain-containing protein [Serratia fonticola]CAI1138107.1 Prophage tail fibre N-terminal [Serratia fonticola]
MAVISGVLKGPMGDALEGVVIELRALRTSATVITQERSTSVTNASGRYSLTVEPGDYSVFISAFGRTPENRGSISVKVNSATGTLNDFLLIPGETDLNPEIVATVDRMRADAAASATAAKTSADNAAATLTNSVKRGEFGIGGAAPALPLVDTLNAVKLMMSGKYTAWAGSEGMPRTDTAYMLDWTLASTTGGIQGVVFAMALITAPSSFDRQYRNVCRNGVFQGWHLVWDDAGLPDPSTFGVMADCISPGPNWAGTYRFNSLTGTQANSYLSFEKSSIDGTIADGGTVPSWVVGNTWGFGMRIMRAKTNPTQCADIIITPNGKVGIVSHYNAKSFEFLTTGNTTFDANGFVKKASPIVKLFGTGESELNDESQGVTTERVSEGVYRISGTLGFNADAEWGGVDGGIEIPTDRNKLPLVWVDYEVDETGDLLIKTFHRVNSTAPKFAQNVKTGYKEGQPIDIPAGRWIDLRVEMPGGDEPEYEPVPVGKDAPEVTPEVTEPEGGEEQAPGETPSPIEEPKE